MIQDQIANFFEKNGWVKIEKFLDVNMCNLFYHHVILADKRYDYVTEKFGEKFIDTDVYGIKNDTQALGDYSKYGDPIFDALLSIVTEHFENFTNLKLNPSYTYHRLYTTGTELLRHKDRPSCEISGTLCLGYDITNVDEKKYPDYNWPMFVGTKDGKENEPGLPVRLNPGDLLIYKGCDVEHWREPFLGKNQAQLFLHYNEKKGIFDIMNDGRAILGLPSYFRDTESIKKNYVEGLNIVEKNKNKIKKFIE
jgi:hypothetical protein